MTFNHPSSRVGKITMQCKGDHRKALRDMKLSPDKVKLDAIKIETWGDGRKYKNRRCVGRNDLPKRSIAPATGFRRLNLDNS